MKAAQVQEMKTRLLRDETALTPTEAAQIIGCRVRDLGEFIQPTFRLRSRPKYRQADVLAVRDRLVEAQNGMRTRNRELIRQAAA